MTTTLKDFKMAIGKLKEIYGENCLISYKVGSCGTLQLTVFTNGGADNLPTPEHTRKTLDGKPFALNLISIVGEEFAKWKANVYGETQQLTEADFPISELIARFEVMETFNSMLDSELLHLNIDWAFTVDNIEAMRYIFSCIDMGSTTLYDLTKSLRDTNKGATND